MSQKNKDMTKKRRNGRVSATKATETGGLKKKLHKSDISKPVTTSPSTATTTTTPPSTNAYITEIQKKIRNVSKKLDRANKTAARQAKGEELTAQQQQQIARRSDLQLQYEEWTTMRNTFLKIAAVDKVPPSPRAPLVASEPTPTPPRPSPSLSSPQDHTQTKADAQIAATTSNSNKKKKKKNKSKGAKGKVGGAAGGASEDEKKGKLRRGVKGEKGEKREKKGEKKEEKKGKKKRGDREQATATTRTFTAETGASFPIIGNEAAASNNLLNNTLKCLTVANFVRSFAAGDSAVAEVVRCSDTLCGQATSTTKQKDQEEPGVDECLASATECAQLLSSSGSTETARVLRAVNAAIEAIRKKEDEQKKVKQAKSVLGTEESAFNFFAAEEDDEMSLGAVAANAIRRAFDESTFA